MLDVQDGSGNIRIPVLRTFATWAEEDPNEPIRTAVLVYEPEEYVPDRRRHRRGRTFVFSRTEIVALG